ncbi:beta-ribofuranosylaminobenzene 5'-phosphate synthase family protein [Candidatus Harpocratesius sp.]
MNLSNFALITFSVMHFLIHAPARIHMSLIDLNGSLGRIDGGFGFGIQNPHLEIEFWDKFPESSFNKFKLIEFKDSKVYFLGNDEQKDLLFFVLKQLEREYSLSPRSFFVRINQVIPSHKGFGSKTQILLSLARGICEIYKLSFSVSKLTKLVQRGGTSGIGYQVFEKGGFHLDLGHTFGPQAEKQNFLPSSATNAFPALPFFHFDFPEKWKIILLLPQVSQEIANKKEVSIFSVYTPILQSDVEKIAHRLLFQVIPGILQQNLTVLADGIWAINNMGFKKIELSLQHSIIPSLLTNIYNSYQIPIGLSSFGPVLYTIVEKSFELESFKKHIQSFLQDFQNAPIFEIFETLPDNRGAFITHNK